MPYAILPVTPFAQNCSLLWCATTHKAALIDPGGDVEQLLAALRREDVELDKILLTHGHLDHVGGAKQLARRLGVPILGPEEGDAYWLDILPQQAQMFGFPPAAAFRPDQWLHEGDAVDVGELSLEVLHCPGHTPGHIVFFQPAERLAFVGDVLFQGSVGRSDFPLGNHRDLLHSIRHKLLPLGDDVAFVPGHGAMSDFGTERRSNPFLIDRT